MSKISKEKENGVIYTPDWIVALILNEAGYQGDAILNSCIIEPGCGEGAFLVQIVERFIGVATSAGLTKNEITSRLEKNIHGYDIDPASVIESKKKLDAITKKYGLGSVRWSVDQKDLTDIKFLNNMAGKFDFVVGNPPYVRLHNLPPETRERIKKNFSYCQEGTTDLYFAFFEMGLRFLKPKGTLGFITPNTYLKSIAARTMRDDLSKRKLVRELIDFGSEKVFKNATTYPLITILDKRSASCFDFKKGYADGAIEEIGEVDSTILTKESWILSSNSDLARIKEIIERGTPLGKISTISNGIATLRDRLFIFDDPEIRDNIAILPSGKKIEKNVLRPIIKASTYKGVPQNKFIIFPYEKTDAGYKPIKEKDFKQRYPLAYKYFLANKDELLLRDRDKESRETWYAYGRSQGLRNVDRTKIITSSINKHPQFHLVNDELVYSGLFLTSDQDLGSILKHLNSAEMEFYMERYGKDFQNGYKSYSARVLRNFGILDDSMDITEQLRLIKE
jgi:adenine-specific DNA-methyltransferase